MLCVITILYNFKTAIRKEIPVPMTSQISARFEEAIPSPQSNSLRAPTSYYNTKSYISLSLKGELLGHLHEILKSGQIYKKH